MLGLHTEITSQLSLPFNVSKGQIWVSCTDKCSCESSLQQHVLLTQAMVKAGAIACPAEKQVCFQGGVDGCCRQDPRVFASLFAAFSLKCLSGYARPWARGVGHSFELWGPSLHVLGLSDFHEPSAESHFHGRSVGHTSSDCGAVRMTMQLLLKNLVLTSQVNDIPVLFPHPGRMPLHMPFLLSVVVFFSGVCLHTQTFYLH